VTSLLPLFLLWAAGNKGGTTVRSAKRKGKGKGKAPQWPTPKSPPPMPAFHSRATTPPAPVDPGATNTPLAELHANPPMVPTPTTDPIESAKHAATQAIRQRTAALARQAAISFNPFAKKSAPTSTALVSQLQTILTNHGGKVVRDGLYGPQTASAWSALAKRKGLAPTISREGPKIAKVDAQTFQTLSVPPIP